VRDQYTFNISLSVLNHLGRNLYRSIITVIGEAISNSWDADAHNVWINIDKEKNFMTIIDDGDGMTDEDFQEKFLKIGYSKRRGGNYQSELGRPFIGRKGIGKLALLSCAEKIHVLSKVNQDTFAGGVIDNSELDKAITNDVNSQDYQLQPINDELKQDLDAVAHGTLIYFENVTAGITNTVDYIKKAIALYFRFSLYDETFSIFVNDDKIDEGHLKDLASNTQFLWTINGFKDPLYEYMENVQVTTNHKSALKINGYIASVEKPSQLKIRGAQERATIDLFVNGRLRERDILRHIKTARIVENYVYGQIHFDELDMGDSKDIFTSSRESIVVDAPGFAGFIEELDRIFKKILDEWDENRRKHGNDGDPDNPKITKKERKAQELFNETIKEIEGDSQAITGKNQVEQWAQALSEEAQFNIPSYTECFIAENLLRKYIDYSELALSKEAKSTAEKWKRKEKESKDKANISYAIRESVEDVYYLDMDSLANLVDKPQDKFKDAGIGRSATVYKPIRDAVGHTSVVTSTAKSQLTIVFENIKARLLELLQSVNDENET